MKITWKLKILIFILTGLYGIGLPYLIVAVGYWNYNPVHWNMAWRIITLMFGLIWWRTVHYNTLLDLKKKLIKKHQESTNESSTNSKN